MENTTGTYIQQLKADYDSLYNNPTEYQELIDGKTLPQTA